MSPTAVAHGVKASVGRSKDTGLDAHGRAFEVLQHLDGVLCLCFVARQERGHNQQSTYRTGMSH
jgi:hypothetical protein